MAMTFWAMHYFPLLRRCRGPGTTAGTVTLSRRSVIAVFHILFTINRNLATTMSSSSSLKSSPASSRVIDSLTITFGDRAENHVGMQKIGTLAERGFALPDLQRAQQKFEELGCLCQTIDLRESLDPEVREQVDPAYVTIIHGAVDGILREIGKTSADMFEEQASLDHDKMAFMYGRVVQKHARWNLCFSGEAQDPSYESGKGRIVSYDSVPILGFLRARLGDIIGDAGANLEAEGNYYYDSKKCGIGFHGDSERKKVVAVRLGATIPLEYRWFHQGRPVGEPICLEHLSHGSMYIMSEKATGCDWRRKVVHTLRHAAGAKKFRVVKKEKDEK